jgi:hypothetical protein
MGDIVDIVLAKEIDSQDPRARHNDFIDPFTVHQDFGSFDLIHDNLAFLLDSFFVTADANNQVSVREKLFGLFQDFCVANVIHIKDTICIDSHWIFGIGTIRLLKIFRFTKRSYHTWSHNSRLLLNLRSRFSRRFLN